MTRFSARFAFLLAAAIEGLLAQGGASLTITSVPPYGVAPGSLSGVVSNADPAGYKVATLIFIPGLGFYSKPTCAATTTPLAGDGSFSALLTTGAADQYATMIAVLVVPASSVVPCYQGQQGVPESLEQMAVAMKLVPRPNSSQREIQFAGQTWLVKSLPVAVHPGPNFFSDSAENVWVDAQDRLHLRITKRGGIWYSAEIVSKRAVGYGSYTLQIDTPPNWDQNVVFGAFSWAEAERNSREVDLLELGRFGNAADTNNAQYVVQPYTIPGNQHRFQLPGTVPVTHKMAWMPEALSFESHGQSGLLHNWTYGATPPATDSNRLNFRLNLWLLAPPTDDLEVEVVVNKFTFTPITKVGVFSSGAWLLDFNGTSNGTVLEQTKCVG